MVTPLPWEKRFELAEVLRVQVHLLNQAGTFRASIIGEINRDQVQHVIRMFVQESKGDAEGDAAEDSNMLDWLANPVTAYIVETVLSVILSIPADVVRDFRQQVWPECVTFSNERVKGTQQRLAPASYDDAFGDSSPFVGYLVWFRVLCVNLFPNFAAFKTFLDSTGVTGQQESGGGLFG